MPNQQSANRHRFSTFFAAIFLLIPLAATAAIEFTDEEKQYIEQHPVVNICVDPDWAPYEHLDENNNYTGAIAEYMKVLQANTGLRFEVVHTDTWAQTKEFARQRKCDLVSSMNQTPEREEYLGFTTPYLRVHAALAIRKNDSDITGLDSLAGRKLAVVKGIVYNEGIKLDFPEIQLIEVDEPAEGLMMVSQGKADAFAAAYYNIKYLIKAAGITNLETVKLRKYRSIIRVGVRNDTPELFLIMNKAVKTLSGDDRLRIRDQMEQFSN